MGAIFAIYIVQLGSKVDATEADDKGQCLPSSGQLLTPGAQARNIGRDLSKLLEAHSKGKSGRGGEEE